ncbi:UDP-glucuronate decarboxylase [Heracleum sosnowskyi]|uniref:UDP-glucuronate decarboxylase n=1 Tax=Heracleum sosnowskyi TaxID=360622 RepID=A0AAD8JJ34_9APIA|nr:UDP-glucuronate decarboxylase [Heracleum sosnowskyi]
MQTMKQLHKQSSPVSHVRDIEMNHHTYSPKAHAKHPRSLLQRSIHYIFKEQRLLFILVGILIASTFFIMQPTLSRLSHSDPRLSSSVHVFDHESLTNYGDTGMMSAAIGRVPVGIKRKRLRIVVTGGAGFVGSHLVDKLIGRGDEVIVIDNFFTGRKDNVMHHFGNSRFELIRHDVVEPILLEVDQIYHLACPASPVHYKYNPVKTIISFSFMCNYPN